MEEKVREVTSGDRMKLTEIYQEYKWEEINQRMEKFLSGNETGFLSLTEEIMKGNYNGLLDTIKQVFLKNLQIEWREIRQFLAVVVFVVFLSSFLKILKNSFKNKQIAEIAYYTNYMILMILFTKIYENITLICESTLTELESFMKIFFPAYFLLVGTSSGIKTGLLYFQLSGLVIYFIEKVLLTIILPLLNFYLLFIFINGIWEEDRWNLVLRYMKKGIGIAFKLMIAAITGIGFVQSMLIPVLESLKKEGIYHLLDMIPGVGGMAKGTFRMWLASAVIVKNSVGILGCVMILFIAIVPLIKIGVILAGMKISTAFLSIIADKKIVSCMNEVGNGIYLCFQTTGYGILFFLILIAITSYSSSGGI